MTIRRKIIPLSDDGRGREIARASPLAPAGRARVGRPVLAGKPERFGDDLPDRDEINLARRGMAPGEPDGAAGLRRREAQELDPLVANFDVDRDLRHQGDAVAV